MAKRFIVILDDRLVDRLGVAQRSLAARIAHSPIGPQSLFEHPSQRRDGRIDVIEDAHFLLSRMQTMKTSRVLHQRALPRDRHGKKQRVEPGIIEPLADVATRREDESFFIVRNFRESVPEILSLTRSHSSVKHDQVADEALQPIGKVLEMVAPLGQ